LHRAGALPFAIDWRSPLLAGYRTVALLALIAAPLVLLVIDDRRLGVSPPRSLRRALGIAALSAASSLSAAGLARSARRLSDAAR
jgi:hypothetical protein